MISLGQRLLPFWESATVVVVVTGEALRQSKTAHYITPPFESGWVGYALVHSAAEVIQWETEQTHWLKVKALFSETLSDAEAVVRSTGLVCGFLVVRRVDVDAKVLFRCAPPTKERPEPESTNP